MVPPGPERRSSAPAAPSGTSSIAVHHLLPGVSEEHEAELLGIDSEIEEIRQKLASSPQLLDAVEQMPKLQAYMLLFSWSRSQGSSLVSEPVVKDFKRNPSEWRTRYQNYRHALLYTLRRRKSGTRKYYCGWDTFLLLSSSNIRYALELVYESLRRNLEQQSLDLGPVRADLQTEAAHSVGARALKELEGVSIYGAQLTKLVLGLGRVFSVMALDAEGHAPEVNQFHLSPKSDDSVSEQEGLLVAAVMHLALIRKSGTKLSGWSATQDYDYWLHPVFAPFFVYSHRRKRKIQLDIDLLEGLVRRPGSTIRQILLRNNRTMEEELPEQLHMFGGYYASP